MKLLLVVGSFALGYLAGSAAVGGGGIPAVLGLLVGLCLARAYRLVRT